MTEEHTEQDREKGPRERMGDGIRSGIGVLSAFKDALEETIKDARERGDLSADRAKELMKEALEKAQSAASEARERLDFVNHSEFEELRAAVAALQERVATLEAQNGASDGPPEADSGAEPESDEGAEGDADTA